MKRLPEPFSSDCAVVRLPILVSFRIVPVFIWKCEASLYHKVSKMFQIQKVKNSFQGGHFVIYQILIFYNFDIVVFAETFEAIQHPVANVTRVGIFQAPVLTHRGRLYRTDHCPWVTNQKNYLEIIYVVSMRQKFCWVNANRF